MPDFDFGKNPGLYFVAATLLPLLSFLLLFLAAGIRWAMRPKQEETPSRIPAYIATGAIGLAFVLCLIGFFKHKSDEKKLHHLEEEVHQLDYKVKVLRSERAALAQVKEADALAKVDAELKTRYSELSEKRATARHLEERWIGQIEWARLGWYEPELLDEPSGKEGTLAEKLNDQRKEAEPRQGNVLTLGYKIDTLASIMFLMVTFIATLIHIFSIGYMSEELQPVVEDHHVHTEAGHLHRRGRFGRFFMFLSLFCFSMLNLILADNLFQIFVSWELVGICSYLLIGFYLERTSAGNAANKAFITNRIGDAGFIIGLMIIWTYVGTFNFDEIFKQVRSPAVPSHGSAAMLQPHEIVRVRPVEIEGSKYLQADSGGDTVVLFRGDFHSPKVSADGQILYEAEPHDVPMPTMPLWLLVLAGIGIFTGCVGKSAQFPLSVWLPDAMEGPTPVSALIHAATMVAAGVYLVGRAYPLFTEEVRLIIAYVGSITLFVAATIAIVQTDIKKVLAYSTVSQLGYMMLALGVGGWAVGLFHLITHAFFKALLFLGSGSVIYGCHHEQDMSKMGGLFKKMPVTALTMLVGCLAIMGFPLTAGWYSKDGIIAHAMGFARANPEHLLLFVLPLVTAGITTFYMFRMWFMTFTGEPRDAHVHEHASETPYVMTVPLIILAVCSIAVGWPGMQFGKKSADAHHAATEGHEEGSAFRWPLLDASQSSLEGHIHHAQHPGVNAEFGDPHEVVTDPTLKREAHFTHDLHNAAGGLALLSAGLGFIFAWVIYRRNALDPADAEAAFPGVRNFLWNKWYFDELYSVLLVRPALVIAGWCRAFDTYVIDGIIHGVARLAVWISKWDGKFDNGVIDGLANLIASVAHGIGGWFRTWQTGFLRSYILFLVLAAISLFVLLVFYARQVAAG